MQLSNLTYEEFVGEAREWRVDNLKLGAINLLVGKNSSGKTRILNVVKALGGLLSGRDAPSYVSGTWRADFSGLNISTIPTQLSNYSVQFDQRIVVHEKLRCGRKVFLSRDLNGEGYLYASQLKKNLRFQVSGEQLVASSRRDRLQHPYLEPLHLWGAGVRHVRFGSELGKDNAVVFLKAEQQVHSTSDMDDVVPAVFKKSFERYGLDFKNAILTDLSVLGYPSEDVGLTSLDLVDARTGVPPQFLYVKEDGLSCNTTQKDMSQGMYRALAVIILINAGIVSGGFQTLLIDDIGEGLDFARAKSLVAQLVSKAETHGFQLVMTTNDRFIMNSVPLEYWSVVKRAGGVVSILNKYNARREFDSFKYSGLNNFDFFSGQYDLLDVR